MLLQILPDFRTPPPPRPDFGAVSLLWREPGAEPRHGTPSLGRPPLPLRTTTRLFCSDACAAAGAHVGPDAVEIGALPDSVEVAPKPQIKPKSPQQRPTPGQHWPDSASCCQASPHLGDFDQPLWASLRMISAALRPRAHVTNAHRESGPQVESSTSPALTHANDGARLPPRDGLLQSKQATGRRGGVGAYRSGAALTLWRPWDVAGALLERPGSARSVAAFSPPTRCGGKAEVGCATLCARTH